MVPSTSFSTQPLRAPITPSFILIGRSLPTTLWSQSRPPSARPGRAAPWPSACGKGATFRTGYSLPPRSPGRARLPLGQLLHSAPNFQDNHVPPWGQQTKQSPRPAGAAASFIFPTQCSTHLCSVQVFAQTSVICYTCSARSSLVIILKNATQSSLILPNLLPGFSSMAFTIN